MGDFAIPELDTPFLFRPLPEAIPGDLRPMWRIGALLLILHLASRGGQSSFGRLHVLSWALRDRQHRAMFGRLLAGDVAPDAIVVRIEPALNQAVTLAHAERLIELLDGRKARLTVSGEAAARSLAATESLFEAERGFLTSLGKRVTEKLVRENLLRKN